MMQLPCCDALLDKEKLMMMNMGHMGGIGWMMMGGMGLIWILIAAGLILGILALIKFLRGK